MSEADDDVIMMEDVDDSSSTGVIKAMDASSVQRIVAGQAVTDLASATKELVDNALDAGAKTINIRLFNQGIDVLEVSDDGTGVPMASRPFMARKHATSKISSFQDIYTSSNTLGFRGEALFCLANISERLVVHTRTKDDTLGQKLEYGRDGELNPASVTLLPRKVGTTVAVGKLFAALPVRRVDLMKRIKAQRAKVVSMIQGYAILCLGVRFNLIDVTKRGNSFREEIKLSTTNNTTRVEQTVSSIMGSRFLSGLTRISIDLTKALAHNNAPPGEYKVEGLVSKAPALTSQNNNVAREAQFFSINGRPVELPKVSRALGDAWRALEGTKKRPACVLCFHLPNNEFDVNLSPDKREVHLTHQDSICALIHEVVSALWSNQNGGNFAENGVSGAAAAVEQSPVAARQEADATMSDASSPELSPGKRRKARRRNAFVHDFSKARLPHQEDDNLQPTITETIAPAAASTLPSNTPHAAAAPPARAAHPSPPRDTPGPLPSLRRVKSTDEERARWSSLQARFNNDSRQHQQDEIEALQVPRPDARRAFITPEVPPFEEQDETRSKRRVSISSKQSESVPSKRSKTLTLEDYAFRPTSTAAEQSRTRTEEGETDAAGSSSSSASRKGESVDVEMRSASASADVVHGVRSQPSERQNRQSASQAATETNSTSEGEEERPGSNEGVVGESPEPEKALVWNSFQGTDAIMKATKDARFSMRQFRKELRSINKSPPKAGGDEAMVSGIDEEPAENDSPPEGHQSTNVVSLSKEDFRTMTVIGQFNLGFILAKCRNNHLWILDQHACDEKYNFERLCATTKIHEQKLMAPMPLELSPSEETCILENMQVFEENGFRFQHNEENPPGQRLALTALPHSGAQDGRKAVQFGKEDVHALCAMLSSDCDEGYNHEGGTGADGSGMYGNNAVRRHAGVSQTQGDTANKVIARLPKAIAMFANRACRGSIMIGTALSQKEMETVVKRLADVEQPWNCPHGRPTMRHVKDLSEIMAEDAERAAVHVAGPTMAVLTQQDVATQEEP